MEYDDFLAIIGEKGKWSVVNFLFLCVPPMCAGMFVIQSSFTAMEPDEFRCPIPGCDGSDAEYEDYNSSLVIPPKEDGQEPDYCRFYRPSFLVLNESDECPAEAFSSRVSTECSNKLGYLYPSDFEFESTAVTEFDLVCDQGYLVALIGSIYMSGLLFGSVFLGRLADMIGRKPALFLAMFVGCTGSLANTFCQNYISFVVCRFITAIGHMGLFMLAFNMTVEICGPETKTFASNLIHVPFAIGEALVSLIAMLVSWSGNNDWRVLQFFTSAPLYAFLLLWFLLPESPRWLIATERLDQARDVLQKAVKMNKAEPVDFSNLECKKDNHGHQLGFKSLFATPALRRNSLIMFWNWMVVSLGYYGLSMISGDLGVDVFLSFILISLVEVPADLFCCFVMDNLGRRPLFVYSLLLTGVFCISAGLLEEGALKTALALVGKFGASAGFAIVYLFTAELYPTEIRSTAIGTCSMFSRLGGIAAPQVVIFLPKITGDAVPLVVLGLTALSGGILAIWLPETLGVPLMETLQEVDELDGAETKPFFEWWSKKRLREQQLRYAQNQNNKV